MTHTPGPWKIKRQPKKSIWVLSNEGFHIAEVNKYAASFGNEKDLQNARLIAAAPELLGALEGVLHHNDAVKPVYRLPASLITQIQAAIAKAKGQL